jgi:hypothetical protein
MNYNELLELIESRIGDNEVKIQNSINNELGYAFYTGRFDALIELKKTILAEMEG